MDLANINEDRFRQALFEEMPGLAFLQDSTGDMLNLRFILTVRGGVEIFLSADDAFDQVRILAERLRQDCLVKTGASRIVRAANDQAEQYRLENVRLGSMVQDRDDKIKKLEARIEDLQDQISEDL